jgi:DNA-binding transcriptional regulator YdaS (Cro superfamily)
MPNRKRVFHSDDSRPAACRRAIAAAGGYRELAKKLGITPQAVFVWPIVPVERARRVEELTGIPVEELRPDIWPPDHRRNAA